MSDIAIRVENLGKQYRIGAKQRGYKRFTETAMDALTAPVRRLRSFGKPSSPDETFWALRDVSFEIQRGEAVGIIGRNGAGKSTLLKILSRITEPTTGRVELHGRVASLLEVGTGFHPELTGRENVYLNGAILGMRRAEIDRKFDEIVDFSGVEKFLDTPVKRYSSGMQVRLAFAVAAHLEPEILLVDEVLAVGDAEFQKKCLGKMGEVASGGRTVLFVSHNMTAIRELCSRGILLASGTIALYGVTDEVLGEYMGANSTDIAHVRRFDHWSGDLPVKPVEFKVTDGAGLVRANFAMDEQIDVQLLVTLVRPIPDYHMFINLYRSSGELLFGSASWDILGLDPKRIVEPGRYVWKCQIPPGLLNAGQYVLSVNGQTPGRGFIFKEEEVLRFEVLSVGGAGGAKSASRPGIVRPLLQWEVGNC